jgi:hypothetical protein
VGFHDQKKVAYCKVDRKSNDIINRLEKTREEKQPDFKAEKEVGGMRLRYARTPRAQVVIHDVMV